jgi:hypothetical protein
MYCGWGNRSMAFALPQPVPRQLIRAFNILVSRMKTFEWQLFNKSLLLGIVHYPLEIATLLGNGVVLDSLIY